MSPEFVTPDVQCYKCSRKARYVVVGMPFVVKETYTCKAHAKTLSTELYGHKMRHDIWHLVYRWRPK